MEDLLPRWLPDKTGKVLLAVVWGLNFSPQGSLYKTVWVSSYLGGWFNPACFKRQGRSCTAFYDLSSEVTRYHFCTVSLVTYINLDSLWEGTTQRHKEQEMGILRNHLGGWWYTIRTIHIFVKILNTLYKKKHPLIKTEV